jgi:hypothetical protein
MPDVIITPPPRAATDIARDSSTMPGPVAGTRLTAEYVRQIGRFADLWAWPLVNVHNRRVTMEKVPEPGLSGGASSRGAGQPSVHASRLHRPDQRFVACPNQDVVYGLSIQNFHLELVVVQVPDFGDRFWVYQVCDQRTDSYADIGKMYHTPPGFYLLVGPDWTGTPPNGIETVFRCPTWVGCVIPRVFQSDEPADKKTVQPLINQILAYPLSKFDGKPKTKDWTHLPSFPSASQGDEEVTWVVPETFFDVLGSALDEAPPLSGEEAVYAQVRSVLQAAEKDAALKKVLHESAIAANKELVAPLFEFRNYGLPAAEQLDDNHERGGVRGRLLHAHRCRQVEHLRQQGARDTLLLPGTRCVGRAAQRRESLHGHLPEGTTPTGTRVLVSDAVQRAPLLLPKRSQTLLARHEEQGSQNRRRRIAYDIRAARSA